MTRENKIALIIGFSLILVVGVLVSDHLSRARQVELADAADAVDPQFREAGHVPDPVFQAPTGRLESPVYTVAPQPQRGPGLLEEGLGQGRPGAPSVGPEPTLALAQEPDPEPEPLLIAQGRASEILSKADQAIVDAGRRLGVGLEAVRNSAPSVPLLQREAVSRENGARREAEPVSEASFVEYHVRENDSLYTIAQRALGSGDRWLEIQALNRDRVSEEGHVRVGVRLRLPAGSRLSDASSASRAPESRPAEPRHRTYVVQRGDTLGQISARMLGSARRAPEILELNKDQVRDADHIRVGMTLRIPAS